MEFTAQMTGSKQKNTCLCNFNSKDVHAKIIQKSRLGPSQLNLSLLPLSHDYPPIAEDAFLSAIINYTNSSTVHFKLSPTYVLYMTCRYVMSSQYRPDISPSERTHKVIAIVNKMVSMMEGVIQVGVSNFY